MWLSNSRGTIHSSATHTIWEYNDPLAPGHDVTLMLCELAYSIRVLNWAVWTTRLQAEKHHRYACHAQPTRPISQICLTSYFYTFNFSRSFTTNRSSKQTKYLLVLVTIHKGNKWSNVTSSASSGMKYNLELSHESRITYSHKNPANPKTGPSFCNRNRSCYHKSLKAILFYFYITPPSH